MPFTRRTRARLSVSTIRSETLNDTASACVVEGRGFISRWARRCPPEGGDERAIRRNYGHRVEGWMRQGRGRIEAEVAMTTDIRTDSSPVPTPVAEPATP